MQGEDKVRPQARPLHAVLSELDSSCFKASLQWYFDWLKNPLSRYEQEDQHLLVLIKEHYLASGDTYRSCTKICVKWAEHPVASRGEKHA